MASDHLEFVSMPKCLKCEVSMSKSEEEWSTGYASLRQYVSANQDALVPATYVDQRGFKLGLWLITQRKIGGRLVPKRHKLLEQQGVIFDLL